MAINKKLIHFKKKETFNNESSNGNILDTSICFILDSKEIITHGTIYKTVNWKVLGTSISTFSIDGVSYEFEDGMTWGKWCGSKYNTNGYYVDYLTFGGASSIYIVSDEYITDGSGNAWSPVAVFKQDKDLDMDYALSEEPTNKIIPNYNYRLFNPGDIM